jgi:hypothetical protein
LEEGIKTISEERRRRRNEINRRYAKDKSSRNETWKRSCKRRGRQKRKRCKTKGSKKGKISEKSDNMTCKSFLDEFQMFNVYPDFRVGF